MWITAESHQEGKITPADREGEPAQRLICAARYSYRMDDTPPRIPKSRKSSRRVPLVLISAAAIAGATLGGCSKDEIRRDVYANREDCLADWGNDPKDCEPAYDRPESRGASTAYYGRPYTYHGGGASPSRTGKTIGSQTTSASRGSSVSRGGFGTSARSSGG
jgi:uncharacterized protein YgiB involved in biofilm formation